MSVSVPIGYWLVFGRLWGILWTACRSLTLNWDFSPPPNGFVVLVRCFLNSSLFLSVDWSIVRIGIAMDLEAGLLLPANELFKKPKSKLEPDEADMVEISPKGRYIRVWFSFFFFALFTFADEFGYDFNSASLHYSKLVEEFGYDLNSSCLHY